MTDTPGTSEVAERLYYGSAALDFEATVKDIRLVSAAGRGPVEGTAEIPAGALWQVALDRTAFYPEGGGQPWDTGVLVATARSGATLEVPVERVEEDDTGEVWHFVRKPLVEGTEVEGFVDAARRLDHEQQHSGQHLLSAMFWREMQAGTVSFHLGGESSTIDLDGAERPSEAQLRSVEEACNRVVYEQRAMLPHWVESEFAAEMLRRGDLRKLPARTGRMRVVQMQGIEFNACGGTHVRNTGEIGAVLIRRVEKVKAGWRVEFVCGGRAVRAARADFSRLADIAGRCSVSAPDVPGRVAALLEENKAGAKDRRVLLEELAESRAVELVRTVPLGGTAHAIYADKEVEFARRVAAAGARSGRSAVVGVTEGERGAIAMALLAGSAQHAGNLMRAVLTAAGARGGGSAEMAQGVCTAEQVEGLMALLVVQMITMQQDTTQK